MRKMNEMCEILFIQFSCISISIISDWQSAIEVYEHLGKIVISYQYRSNV
jgi:hypothetical protein